MTRYSASARLFDLRGREVNPVLLREVRARFRGGRAVPTLMAFLVFVAAVGAIFGWWTDQRFPREVFVARGVSQVVASDVVSAAIGQSIFRGVIIAEMLLVTFIAPALTMNAISGEVERQTYDLLLATPLSGWAILTGKVGAAIAYVLLLVLSALPVVSLAFVFGGVSATGVLQAQVSVLMAALLFATIGVCCSSLTSRSLRSVALSYMITIAVCLLPIVVAQAILDPLRMSGQPGMPENKHVWAVLLMSPVTSIEFILHCLPHDLDPYLVCSALAPLLAQTWFFHACLTAVLFALTDIRIRRSGRRSPIVMLPILLLGLWWAWAMSFPAFPW